MTITGKGDQPKLYLSVRLSFKLGFSSGVKILKTQTVKPTYGNMRDDLTCVFALAWSSVFKSLY